MKVRIDGRTRTGPAVELPERVDPHEVVAAVRKPADERVIATPPGPVHEHVGLVHPGMTLRPPAALASAARSLGDEAPQDESLVEVRAALAEGNDPTVDLVTARQRVVETHAGHTALRERVARLGGQAEARRKLGVDTDEVESRLHEAVRRLSEVETERLAAEQSFEAAQSQARSVRDLRERRLRLEDRERNLERAARAYLAERRYSAFAEALRAVPGTGDAGADPGEYEGAPMTAALAVARLAAIDAPLVLACDRFESASAARDCLDAPVIRVEV